GGLVCGHSHPRPGFPPGGSRQLNSQRGSGRGWMPAYTRGMKARERRRERLTTPVGGLVKPWRERRGMSQLGLAAEAEISARHLSFLETGRTQPSREMVLRLSRVLDVPLRSRNELLTAAGFAPIYRETILAAPEMAQARAGLDLM